MLEELADLIDEAVTYMNPAERAPIYEEALDLLAELVIEIPTYQRKNLFVYDDSVIKSSSLSAEVTPYWGPMAEIWKVELNG
jgi:ABC-type transport system substrate-binding protein